MFDYLYEWIKNLAFYLVLVTAVLHMLPSSGYKKYIRFFTGLVLILMLCTPVLKLFGMEQKITELYHSAEYEEEIKRMEEMTGYLNEIEPEDYLGNAKTQAADTEEEEEGKIEVEEIRIGR